VNTVVLSPGDVAIAAVLVVVHAGISIAFQLGLARQVLIAAARMVVQLALIGHVLRLLFEATSPWWTLLAAVAMLLFAGREVGARQERRLSRGWNFGIGTTAMLLASTLVTLLALTTAVRPEPWHSPRFAIPILGMVLGNTMSGVALGMRAVTERLTSERPGVEARLLLGATRWQATRTVATGAMRTALLPIVQTMAATGLVFLPGAMTGQLLAGADPQQAVLYQMLLIFLIAGGTALGSTTAVWGMLLRLTDARDRLRLDRLSRR
jgi:putative ABC transport system permease protein